MGRRKGELIKIRVLGSITKDVNSRRRETKSFGSLLGYLVVADVEPKVYPSPGGKSGFI
jgi:hypothetical protein